MVACAAAVAAGEMDASVRYSEQCDTETHVDLLAAGDANVSAELHDLSARWW